MPGLTPEQVLIALIGEVGWIAVCIGIVALHGLAEKAVLAIARADLDG